MPKTNFNFLDSSISQSITTPYYFNISEDKELYLTPTIKYGGGVDSSQTIGINYNQILSGGNLSSNYLMATNLENEGNKDLITDAFVSLKYNQNLIISFSHNTTSISQPVGSLTYQADEWGHWIIPPYKISRFSFFTISNHAFLSVIRKPKCAK